MKHIKIQGHPKDTNYLCDEGCGNIAKFTIRIVGGILYLCPSCLLTLQKTLLENFEQWLKYNEKGSG